MRRAAILPCLICSALLLGGCDRPARVELVTPYVPAELRQPCPAPKLRDIVTEGQAADAIIGLRRALGCANGRIVALDEVLVAAESVGRP